MTGSPQPQDLPLPLTPRQFEIFGLMAKGLSNRDICELLGISSNTVKIHVSAILRNLNVANRTEAVFAYKELLNAAPGSPVAASSSASTLRMANRIGRPALAVLPFVSLHPDSNDPYLGEGVVEELLDQLSAWQWFPVIAYGSSRNFAAAELDPQEVGQRLGAAYLISGSLRSDRARIKVSTRLIQTASAQAIWSHSFVVANDDLFSVQADIARHVVHAIAPEMIDAETHRMKHRPPSTLSSWSLVCKGTWHLNQDEESAVRTALDCFDQAIAEDADFSLGWNGRVCVYQKQLYRQWADDPRKTIVKLAEDAATCLRLEPRAAHGHASVGLGHILMGNRDAATTHLEQAVALNPSSSRALVLLAQAYGMSGRLDECIMLVEDLLRLDPVSASAYRYRCILAMSHLAAGRTDDAILWANGAIAANPRAANGYLPLIAALVEQGTPDDANAALEEMRRNDPSFDIGKHLDMMRPFTRPELLRHFVGNLATVGLTD